MKTLNTQIFLLLTLIIIVFGCDQCPTFSRTSLPISTRIGAGCTCTNSYPPSNYEYVDVSYSYGQKISQSFYQNGRLVGDCPLSQNCNKRISLNPNYGVTIVTQRQTATNSYGTRTNGHSVNFGKKIKHIQNNAMCYYPPEINSEENEQSGFITAGCVYSYTNSFANTFVIDMNFNNTVTLKVMTSDKIIVYVNSSDTFFEQIDNDFDNITILLSSTDNVEVNWFNVYELYSDSSENSSISLKNTYSVAVASIVIGVICVLSIIGTVIGSYFVIKNKNKYSSSIDTTYERM